MSLSEKRMEDLIHLTDTVTSNGWNGVRLDMTAEEIADELGFSHWEYTRLVRAAKENPDLGISVSTRRGRFPYTVFTVGTERVSDEITSTLQKISEAKAEENFKRTIREATTSFVAWNKTDKTRSNSRQMRRYAWRMKSFLQDVQALAAEDGDPFKVREMAERALALVGVHYDDDGAA